MAASPADYQFMHGLRRKGITLVCFVLASTIIMGISAYIDSYSVHEWNRLTDVGPFAMSVNIYDPYYVFSIEDDLGAIRSIPGVERAAYIERSYGSVNIENGSYYSGYYGSIAGLGSDFLSIFPEAYVMMQGRLPTNVSEIALGLYAAQSLPARVGETVNCSLTTKWALLSVVGIYSAPPQLMETGYYYALGVAVVDRTFMLGQALESNMFLDVNRIVLTPFDTSTALSYLSGIEEEIRALDPSYNPPSTYYSRYNVYDLLGSAIFAFVSWKTMMRYSEIARGGTVILLVVLTMILAVRFNVNDRRYENSVLVSRGADKSDLDTMVIKELAGITVVGLVLGTFFGLLISRVAVVSTGFFEFDQAAFWKEPFLVTIESILISVILGLVLPTVSYVAYKAIYSTKRVAEAQTGKLARVSRLLVLVRWDFAILILTGLVMLLVYSAGTAIKVNPLLTLIAQLSPAVMFIGLASLAVKGFRRGANWLSRRMSRIAGHVPSYGIRRIGKEASSAGLVAVIIVLSLTIAWGYAFVGSSIPLTKVNQARLAFGADITFHTDKLSFSDRVSFAGNVSLHPEVKASTSLSVFWLMLAGSSYVSVVAMDPSEYLQVGYDYEGTPLESSQLNQAMISLESIPNGIIITSDIASEYDLSTGDTIRTAYSSVNGSKVIVFTILAVAPALSDALLLDTGYLEPHYGPIYYGGYTTTPPYYWWHYEVGMNTMWANKEYLADKVNLTAEGTHLYCVRAVPDSNTTDLAQEIIGPVWNSTITSADWASVTKDASGYVSRADYRIDRSLDTMFTVCMVLSLFAAFVVYIGEDVQARRREVALLRAMGSSARLVAKVQAAEMLALAFSSMILVLAFSPVFIINSLITYNTSYYIFPVMVTLVVPWVQLVVILFLFLGSITVFVAAVAIVSPRVKLAAALNAAWAEASPYGGDI